MYELGEKELRKGESKSTRNMKRNEGTRVQRQK
jgi:hypothetical protein